MARVTCIYCGKKKTVYSTSCKAVQNGTPYYCKDCCGRAMRNGLTKRKMPDFTLQKRLKKLEAIAIKKRLEKGA